MKSKINWGEIEAVELGLRMFVHGWDIFNPQDCIDSEKDNVFECPKDHGHKVTIVESFVWTLADRLLAIRKEKDVWAMENLLRETLMMYTTFKRHKDEYPTIFRLTKNIYRACYKKERQ